jgi:hypothetical protein
MATTTTITTATANTTGRHRANEFGPAPAPSTPRTGITTNVHSYV